MIELALRGGGPDNITCIVADVVDIDFGEDAPIMGGAGRRRQRGLPARLRRRHARRPPRSPAPCRAGSSLRRRTRPQRRRSRVRIALACLAVVAVLVAGAVLARVWVLQQYYVGAESDRVTIFQGVRGTVLGIPLQQVAEQSDIVLESPPRGRPQPGPRGHRRLRRVGERPQHRCAGSGPACWRRAPTPAPWCPASPSRVRRAPTPPPCRPCHPNPGRPAGR